MISRKIEKCAIEEEHSYSSRFQSPTTDGNIKLKLHLDTNEIIMVTTHLTDENIAVTALFDTDENKMLTAHLDTEKP